LEKNLHIVCLTVPYPVNYGGVYDLFYKLPALQAMGVQIHLHCFDYGRGKQEELNKYCASVQYYQRNTGYRAFAKNLPYIVGSRKNETLLNDLLQDEHPILMEGIHCTALFTDERFNSRKKFVRLHNVEYEYYKSLFTSAGALFNKLYYWRESKLLKKYEAVVAKKATAIFSVTPKDRDVYYDQFGSTSTEYLPLFMPPGWQAKSLPGMGAYCLYHGDLSVEMNEEAATWLIKKIFPYLKIPLVIAGKDPSKKLQKLAGQNQQVCLLANPSGDMMQDMIVKAHINILPSFSHTGIKIKLVNALFNGRHCIVTPPTVEGTGLESLCHIIDTAEAMKQRIEALYHQPFSERETEDRGTLLTQMFSNQANAQKLVSKIWGSCP
jgi:hypothetical protein